MKRASRDDTKFEDIQAINSTFGEDLSKTLSEEYFFREAIEKGDVHMICLRRKYQSEKFQLLSESLQDKIFTKLLTSL